MSRLCLTAVVSADRQFVTYALPHVNGAYYESPDFPSFCLFSNHAHEITRTPICVICHTPTVRCSHDLVSDGTSELERSTPPSAWSERAKSATPERTVMSVSEGGNGRPPSDVVRTQRVEIVDQHGTVRGCLGMLGTDANDTEHFGLELRSKDGTARVSMLLGDDDSLILVEQCGNARVVAGLERSPDRDDPDDEIVHGGAYMFWCDGDGRPVTGFRCRPDGSVVPHPGDPA